VVVVDRNDGENNGDEHKVTSNYWRESTQIQQRKLMNEMCKAQKVLGQRNEPECCLGFVDDRMMNKL
jgi:hypothetical protein